MSTKRRKVTMGASMVAPAVTRMSGFARTVKGQSLSRAILHKNNVLGAGTTQEDIVNESKKRKAEVTEILFEDEANHGTQETEVVDNAISAVLSSAINIQNRTIKPLPLSRLQLLHTPRTPHNPIKPSTPETDTPTNGALDHFTDLDVSSACSPIPFLSISASQLSNASQDDLPVELLELVNLHSAFLTALSLHYAHNGTHTPADLRLVCPDVARAWGRRRVLVGDIRRILSVLNTSSESTMDADQTMSEAQSAELSLSDYGFGKICIEIRNRSGNMGSIARPLDENHMNSIFTSNLQAMWEAKMTAHMTARDFINDIQLEPITTCSSLTKMTPLLAKGQQRLQDIRAVMLAQKEQQKQTSMSTPTPSTNSSATEATPEAPKRPTLLERLQAKQRAAATAPAPPTKAALSRTAGLHRLPEVVSVLTLLTTSTSIGQTRVSFTLATVLGKLKDSFKTPMSRSEGEVCVRLLADEIVPEWLRIVKMGRFETLVANREGRIADDALEVRIAAAIARSSA